MAYKKTRRESKFQSDLKAEIAAMFPGCYIQKEDCQQYQGIPDILILYGSKWATLECKKNAEEAKPENQRPNQGWYVDDMNKLSFSRFIYPENKEEVLHELRIHFTQ